MSKALEQKLGLAHENQPDDASLEQRLPGDRQAFAALYDRYFARVYNYYRYRVDDAELADDLTSLTFERALLALYSFNREEGSFKTWIFTISRNLLNDHFRLQRRRPQVPLEMLSSQSGSIPGPESTVILRETQAELLEAVAQLEERQRELLGLKFGAQMTNRQIAELTGLSESNVGVILYRALRQLRGLLGNPK